MKNIVLIGFMGTGKTSTGRVLAQKLGAAFLDLDQEIEAEEGMAIPVIFAQKGEPYFRAAEHRMVERVAARQNAVISTGGGTVKDPANVALLRKSGVIVCLTADVDTILMRTASKGERPVLDKEDKATAAAPSRRSSRSAARSTARRTFRSIRASSRRCRSSRKSFII